jgi:hypothetical protein
MWPGEKSVETKTILTSLLALSLDSLTPDQENTGSKPWRYLEVEDPCGQFFYTGDPDVMCLAWHKTLSV